MCSAPFRAADGSQDGDEAVIADGSPSEALQKSLRDSCDGPPKTSDSVPRTVAMKSDKGGKATIHIRLGSQRNNP